MESDSLASALASAPPKEMLVDMAKPTEETQRSMISTVLGFIPALLFKMVGFATISIPIFFYRVLTWSFTLHLNFSSLLITLAVMATATYLVVRYRFLTKYSRLKPIKSPKIVSSFDLHPDAEDTEYTKPGFKNYPDEFLSAFLSSIKIFGYLEQPVFHELARHLQTKKLLAGDTLFRNPEQERSFYIVVDGHVELFVKPDNEEESEDSDDMSDESSSWKQTVDEEDIDTHSKDKFKKYTLINEVSAGGTLSSLFTILSIFRESFNRSESKERQRQKSTSKSHLSRLVPEQSKLSSPDDWRQVFPGLDESDIRKRKQSVISPHTLAENLTEELPNDSFGLPPPTTSRKLSHSTPDYASKRAYRSVHPNIIARATVDTTLAVIPEEAFHKLTQKFPKAAAHIVQVIVTRFQRVTLNTSHRYLGLTKELLRLEKLVNESASLPELPSDFFAPGGMDRLRHKFNEEEDEEDHTESLPAEINRSDSSGIIQAIGIIGLPGTPTKPVSSPAQGSPPRLYRQQLNRRGEYSMEDDEHLRTSVMKCVSDALGIKPKEETMAFSGSSPRTPRRQPYEERARYPMDLFSHTGTMDATTSPSLDAMEDDEIRSTTSSVQSGSDIFSTGKNELISSDDIQILYFPKDAVLVREGAHNTGLFFVIDGLLEVSMTPSQGEETISEADKKKKGGRRDKFGHRKSHIGDVSFDVSPAESEPLPSTSASSAKVDQVMASDAPAGRSNPKRQDNEDRERAKKPIFIIRPGGISGYMDALTGFPSFVEIKAKTDAYVGYITKKHLDRIIDKNPTVMLKLAKQLVGHVSPLILQIDISLEWMQVSAGQIICREAEPSNEIYMVLHGRLRTIREKKEGEIEILGEFGHGDSVGELEVLTGVPTSATLHAIRDTELARMPKTLFNALALRHPEITLQISRMIAFRSLQLVTHRNTSDVLHINSNMDASTAISSITKGGASKDYPELYGRNNVNLKTIGILPVNASVPVTEFAESLKSALLDSVGATCALLNSATGTTIMGKHAFSRLGKLKMASWLAQQEEKYRIVLYLADGGVTSQWTRTCIRQSDCILLVGLGDGDPSVGEYERFLINLKTTARKELVLLHGERYCASGTTQNWLKNRLWIQAHHHVYMAMRQHASLAAAEKFRPPWLAQQGRKVTAGSINMLTNVKDQIKEYYSAVPPFSRLLDFRKTTTNGMNGLNSAARNDFARLARRLCGKSVALVLGGGGARGVAHVGVIQAVEEAGIPIDIIGGTSIGSFVGGLYARNMDLVSVIARSKMFAGRVSSIWRQIMDLTYPVTAWFTGHEFNRAIWKCIGDSQIEDYWLPYFAVTTNITFSRMEVHTTGYAWRYIRASMSLSGYMPPICDNGNMLVDGGYMDNLPVAVAKNMGADIILAVDVASVDDTSPVYYGDSISGWWALLHGLNPFRTYNIPSIADIQSRLAYVSSVAKLEEAKLTDGTLYLKLPVQQWGTLEFAKYNDIYQTGYDVGKEVVARWKTYASGTLTDAEQDPILKGKEVKGKRARRNSV
ncbi:hypothetical protein G6F56_000700 [Rhizopus delemar]|uniref:Lysophospholipase NTE1 n=1 Tax=Rhizopus stolonifer TaxID=4846 RepID=A0A367KN26_RHIST|nr:hypothetical protein G6F56_000700 [Rhizopus delemar]RCI03242.1 phosphatidylcholine and lysophosphatidylcholine phospholipase [Rhizopus stolonifer]